MQLSKETLVKEAIVELKAGTPYKKVMDMIGNSTKDISVAESARNEASEFLR